MELNASRVLGGLFFFRIFPQIMLRIYAGEIAMKNRIKELWMR